MFSPLPAPAHREAVRGTRPASIFTDTLSKLGHHPQTQGLDWSRCAGSRQGAGEPRPMTWLGSPCPAALEASGLRNAGRERGFVSEAAGPFYP